MSGKLRNSKVCGGSYIFLLRVFQLALAIGFSGPAAAEDRYFPPDVFGGAFQKDSFRVTWYSKHLGAMNEPSLSTGNIKAETYRILWLRSFHAPMAFRLSVEPDGTSLLITKRMKSRGGGDPGELALAKETRISAQGTRALIDDLERRKFWRLDPRQSGVELDGAQWIVEGVKDGKYHVIERFSEDGIADWALKLMRKSGEDLQPIY